MSFMFPDRSSRKRAPEGVFKLSQRWTPFISWREFIVEPTPLPLLALPPGEGSATLPP